MESFFDRQARKVLDFVVGGTRGGPMRILILGELSKRPKNTNEISRALRIDYKTAEYHIRVMKDNGMLTESGDRYGLKYSVSPLFKNWEKVHKARIKSKK